MPAPNKITISKINVKKPVKKRRKANLLRPLGPCVSFGHEYTEPSTQQDIWLNISVLPHLTEICMEQFPFNLMIFFKVVSHGLPRRELYL